MGRNESDESIRRALRLYHKAEARTESAHVMGFCLPVKGRLCVSSYKLPGNPNKKVNSTTYKIHFFFFKDKPIAAAW